MDYLKAYSDITIITAIYFGNVLALIAVFDGFRRLLKKERKKPTFILFFLGLLYCLLNSSLDYYKSKILEPLVDVGNSSFLQKAKSLPANWGEKVEPKTRSCNSKQIAKLYFEKTGEFINYFDLEGKFKLFSPTEEDIRKRDNFVKGQYLIQSEINNNLSSSLYWLFSGFIAMFFAWLSNHKKLGRDFGFNS